MDGFRLFFNVSRFSPGGPAYFGGRNDHSPAYEHDAILIATVATALYIPFVLSVLTARRRRLSTFFIGTLVIASGAAIAVGLVEPRWSVGTATIVSTYSSHRQPGMTASVRADILLEIGLSHYNVTYSNWRQEDKIRKFYYNNRFEMAFGGHACGPKPDNKLRAIEMGLPNPVITVAEYMDTSGGGFEWATAIPQAGHYTKHLLYLAGASFAVTVALLILIPSYGIGLLAITGCILLSCNALFCLLYPSHLRTIIIEGNPVRFYYGSSFLMVLVCGLSDLLASLTLLCIQRVDGMKYVSTFFELDFDTPWDHKILQEESEERRRDSVLTDFSSLNATVRMSVQKVRRSLRFRNNQITEERVTMAPQQQHWGGINNGGGSRELLSKSDYLEAGCFGNEAIGDDVFDPEV